MLPATASNLNVRFPGLREVCEAWTAIRQDLVEDAELEAVPSCYGHNQPQLLVRVVSTRYNDDHPEGYKFVWAQKRFTEQGYLISWGQLLDLLIVAYREMDQVIGRS